MIMNIRSLIPSVLIVVSSIGSAQAADYVWNVNPADPDNIFTNGVHFRYEGRQVDPESMPVGAPLYVQDNTAALTVRLPRDCAYASRLTPVFRAYTDYPFTLDLADASWTQTNLTGTADYTGDGRLRFQLGGNSILQHAYTSSTSPLKKGAFCFSNALATVTYNGSQSSGSSMDFRRGTFDFHHPNGEDFDYAYLYLAAGATSLKDFTFFFRPESRVRMPVALVYGNAPTNVLDVQGHQFIHHLQMRAKDSGGPDTYARTRVNVHGADTVLEMNYFSANSGANPHGYRVEFSDGATMAWGKKYGYHTQLEDADFPFVFNRATFRMTNDNWDDCTWYNALIYATNSTFDTTLTPLKFSGRVALKDTDWSARRVRFGGTASSFSMTGGSFTGDLGFGIDIGSKKGAWQAEFKDAVVTLKNSDSSAVFVFGDVADSYGTGTVENATLTAPALRLANNAGSRATLILKSGAITTSGKFATGFNGSGELVVSGGKLSASQITTAESAAIGVDSSIRQTGGEIVTDGSYDGVFLVVDGNSQNCTGTLVLDGGVLRTSRVWGGGGAHGRDATKTGTARLQANGGTISAKGGTDPVVAYLDEALLGEKGLTIAADADVTIAQSFANQENAEGSLILTGQGVKTLTGTETTVARIVVDGGTVFFADGAKASSTLVLRNGATVRFAGDPAAVGLTGLVCGDADGAGVLTLKTDQPFAVAGDVVLNKVRVNLEGSFAQGTTYAVLTASGTVSADTRTVWTTEALVSEGHDGVSDYVFSAETEDRVTMFRIAVEEPSQRLDLASGTAVRTEAVTFGANCQLQSEIGEDAVLTVDGKMSAGAFLKTGSGRIYLTNAENLFLRGITSAGGLISFIGAGSLGASDEAVAGIRITGGNFEFDGGATETVYTQPFTVDPGDPNAVVGLRTHTPLTVTDVEVKSGNVFKTGAGTLTIAPPSGKAVKLIASNGPSDCGGNDPKSPYYIGDVSDPALSPQTGLMGFNVAEGEVRIVGDKTTEVDLGYGVMVGVSATGGTAQPVLTIDGAKTSLAGNWKTIQLGSFTGTYDGKNVFNTCPRLNITNGAEVSTYTYICGRNCTSFNIYPTVTVDRATWEVSNFRPGYNDYCQAQYFIRNGSAIKTSAILGYGPSFLDVTDSVISKSDGSCVDAEFHNVPGEWTMGSGATLCLRKINQTYRDSIYRIFTLNFDGGTWKTAADWQAFRMYNPAGVVVRTRTADGLTLPVEAERTVYVGHAIVGEGGVVKTGAGTLRFEAAGEWDNETQTVKTPLADPVTLAFEGALDVREGTAFVENGVCRTGGAYRTGEGASIDFDGNALGAATFAGAGSFANGTAANAVISAPLADDGTVGACPSFTDMTLTGVRVDFGRTEPLEGETEGLVVATFPNGAPDVSGWRSRNTGKGTRARFRVADNGKDVLADVAPTGLLLLVR